MNEFLLSSRCIFIFNSRCTTKIPFINNIINITKQNFQKLDNPTITLNQRYLSTDLIVTSVYNMQYTGWYAHAHIRLEINRGVGQRLCSGMGRDWPRWGGQQDGTFNKRRIMINAYQTRSRNIPHDLVSFCRAL